MEVARLLEDAKDAGIDFPAADISLERSSRREAFLRLVLHFSRMVNGPDNDLEVIFRAPLAFQWEDETYGLIELPDELPQCASHQWRDYTFPILEIVGSRWADLYACRAFTSEEYETKKVIHFTFIALNDLVHVLSIDRPTLRWLTSVEV